MSGAADELIIASLPLIVRRATADAITGYHQGHHYHLEYDVPITASPPSGLHLIFFGLSVLVHPYRAYLRFSVACFLRQV